jgi:2-keto-4-pentenoate hydratase/2-oxohepta-3-ene-1,7-dioic acid hydratase in catechol pathway
MRLASFEADGGAGFGVISGDKLIDISAVGRLSPATLLRLPLDQLRNLAEAAEAKGAASELASARLLPPVPRPGKIICLGLNYVDHAKEGGFQVPDYPAVFFRGATSLVAAGQPMVRPSCSITFDYEAELAVVIGRGGRHIAEAEALDAVAGYSIFNDGSIREYQQRSHQWTMGKNFDGSGPFGPWIVTPDELPPGADGLRIQTRLNGRTLQDGNTDDMVFKVARTIAILSEAMTLEPGDVISMGTPPGVGFVRQPPIWLKDGDVCEIEIERIGVLSNPVRDEASDSTGQSVAC